MQKYRVLVFLVLSLPSLCMASSTPLLVTTEWLAGKLSSKDIILLDMSDGMQYNRFHIPGARYLPYSVINHYNRKQVSFSIGSQNIVKVLGQLGIKPSSHIVIYDDVGGLNASRLFWELERIGHNKVSILDGGLVKWILEGRKVVATTPTYSKTVYSQPGKSRNNLASLNEVIKPASSKTILLDARTREEYQGHPRQKRSGHIPGAVWWNWEENVNFENAFQIQPESALLKHANGLGLKDKNQQIIVYCRSGHRAAHNYFTLRKLGYTDVRVYDGSMAEYSQNPQAALNRGNSP